MIKYRSNDSYQMIEEASILGLKINKKKLQDEEYIRKLLDKIQQMEDSKDTINTIIVVLSIISMLTVVGLPIGLLLFEISKKIDKNKEKISDKNKEKINSYIDKSIDKLKKSASKASGDEKEKLEKIINNLEKNKNIIHTNNKIIQFTDKDKFTHPVALDFKKHLENKLKSTGIEVKIGDEDIVYFKYDDFDDTMLASGQESEYYHEKSKQIANAIMSYNKNVLCDKNDNNFTIDKRIEYNNTIIDLSYKEDRFNCFVLPVVSKDMIPNTYTYSQVKTLLKDINIFGTTFYDNKIVIDVHTKNVDTYMKKISSIFKNATISTPERKFKVGQGEIINIEFNSSIKESYTQERGEVKMKSINSLANIARMNELEPTRNRLRNSIVEEYTNTIDSLSTIEESLITNDTSLLPVYKINEGLFKKTQYVSISDRSKKYNKVISSIKEILNKYKLFKLDTKFYTNKNEYNDFINGKQNDIILFNCVFNKCIPSNIKSGKSDDVEIKRYFESELPVTFNNMIKEINEKVKEIDEFYKIYSQEPYDSNSTYGEKEVSLIHSLPRGYKFETVKEGNAIDLDSLKYVVESKKITLDEAIQEFKNINSIEEDASFYCVLPENINENITVESFITLNNTLSKANIIPISNKSINLEDFTIKPQV